MMTNPIYDLLANDDPSQVKILTRSHMLPLTDCVKEMLCALEKKLWAMEAHDMPGLDPIDMCLVPNLVIPLKFIIPKFENHKWYSCPRHHLVMFYWKNTSHTRDNKLMIHCFKDNLSEAPLSWYLDLERSCIQAWRDLSSALLKK